ncbi:hypothetical protein [Haloferula sp. A504]|uniref:hypothetical protein n=1 Tax=Haloferula sp. A504 TaxID=3373601 RepID=UPI0031C30FAF|nr:hypothetical protein [Verrucomicrobiaceae bacterium E54]
MRNYSKTIGALAAASTLVAGYASAELEGEVHVGYHNMYEFRFVDLGQDLIEAGADVGMTFGDFGVSAGVWYASSDVPVALLGGNTKINFDELDLYTGVSYSIGDLTLEAGYIYYYFPDTGTVAGLLGLGTSNTQEVYVGASYDFSFGLSVGSTWYYDFDANNGWYWDTSIGYTVELMECLDLELTGGIAFADGLGTQVSSRIGSVGTADGFQGYYLQAALPWEFRENVTLTPYVRYTAAEGDLATDVINAAIGGTGRGGQDYLVSGVSLAVGF